MNKWKLRSTYPQTIIAYFINDPAYIPIYLRVNRKIDRFFLISQVILFEFSLYRNIMFCILFQVSCLTIHRGNILRYYNDNNKETYICL